MPQQPHDNGRALLLGALTDFLTHLNTMEAPLVVGRDYKPDRLLDEFKSWCEMRNISLNTIDRSLFIGACKRGMFSDENNSPHAG